MTKVYTHFNHPVKVKTNAGTKYLNTYQEQIEDGIKTLIKTGEKNIDDIIQMDLETSKIENILHSVAMGDLSALNAREGTYVDATTMPKTLQEAQNLVLRMKDEFEKMPSEVKEKFNNSAEKYVSLMGTDEFKEIMSPYNKQIAQIEAEKSHKEYLKKVAEGAKLNYDIAIEQARLEHEKGGNE